uniref:Uncharacterized protein n=1 Tax=Panagrolaimus davidi TaxID=227884 RepID=A0A914PT93_9BILA
MATKVLAFLFLCIFATSFAIFQHYSDSRLTRVRMCTCREAKYCFYKVWKSEACSFRNISFDFVEENTGDLESLIQCSAEYLFDSHSMGDVCAKEFFNNIDDDRGFASYIFTNETSFINTKIMENSNQSYCFNGEMTKCLNRESCTLWNHNDFLRNVFKGCAKEHFKNKIEAMKSSNATKFQAKSAEYDFYYIFEKSLDRIWIPQSQSINGGILCVPTMMFIFASIWFM